MPTYIYDCTENHTFEAVRGYDDETTPCTEGVEGSVWTCKAPARRRAVYPGQGVIFSGEGFTKSVIPPAPPEAKSTAGETTEIDFEVKDQLAKESYEHDKNVRPYVKEEKKRRLKNG